MSQFLHFPAWLAVAMALVIELLGLATINTVFQFWTHNQDARKSDPKSPVYLAVITSIYYLAVVLTVNTMLDSDPPVYKLAKGLLSTISVVGGVTIALRAAHSRRVREAQEERERIRAERKGVKFAKSTPLHSANAVRTERKQTAINQVHSYLTEHPDANISEIARAVGRSRPTIYDYMDELKEQGLIEENGHRTVK
jgi:predicted transcriptional regulator